MGIRCVVVRSQSRVEPTIESWVCACEGQMSLKREIVLWKTSLEKGLVVRWSSLAGGNIGRFGQAEGEPTAFFETNRDRGSLARRRFTLRKRRLARGILRLRCVRWCNITSCDIPLRNFPSGTLSCRNLGIAGAATREKAGGLNRQADSGEMDGIQSQTDVTTVALDPGGAGGLHTTNDGSAARDQSVPLDHHRVVDDRLENSVGAGILGGY